MDKLYKGFIETKNKQSVEKFKNRTDFKNYKQVKSLPEFAGVLKDDVILIDVDDKEQFEVLFKIVDEKGLRCRIYESRRGGHFVFKNSKQDTCKTNARLACGLDADIKVGCKNSYEVLKFDGKEREILYDILEDEEYEEVPKWLFPVNSKTEFFGMEASDGRNQSLFNYILTLQSNDFTKDEAIECIKIINDYVFKEPLDESELEIILRDEAFGKPTFYKNNNFLFDKFAKYLIDQHHIVKINGQLHYYEDGIYVGNIKGIEGLMINYIPSLNRSKRKEVLDYLDIYIKENTEQSSANYIAFKNGVYNIDTQEFSDFNPNIIITNKIGYNYNENAYCELTDKTLNKLACNDEKIRDLLEEVIGYTFYRRNELRKAFILIGEKSNGKSTYIDMVKTLLGDENTSALDLKELGDRFKTAELFGKLANLGDDIGDEFVANTSVFKKVISGDRINVERKGVDPFDFNNYSKFIFSANNIPRMGRGKDTGAIVDRLIIVPFDAKFSNTDEDFDPYIKYKLRANESMEYLIQIGLDGLWRVLENRKFTTNERVVKEIEEYEETNNPVLMFFKEVDESEIENEPAKDVYRKYNEFCIANSFTPMSNIEFSKQVLKFYDLEIRVRKVNGKSVRLFATKNS